MDLVESEDHFVLRADLPGLVRGGRATSRSRTASSPISGERKAEQTESKDGYHRVERAFGSFSRSLTLPEGVDAEAITASFDRGVLEVADPEARAAQAAQDRDRRRQRAEDDRHRDRSQSTWARDGHARAHDTLRGAAAAAPRRSRGG